MTIKDKIINQTVGHKKEAEYTMHINPSNYSQTCLAYKVRTASERRAAVACTDVSTPDVGGDDVGDGGGIRYSHGSEYCCDVMVVVKTGVVLALAIFVAVQTDIVLTKVLLPVVVGDDLRWWW